MDWLLLLFPKSSESGISLLWPLYSSLHKYQTPQVPGLLMPQELALTTSQLCLQAALDLHFLPSRQACSFCCSLYPPFRWLALWLLFPVGCGLSLGPSSGFWYEISNSCPHQAVHRLCVPVQMCYAVTASLTHHCHHQIWWDHWDFLKEGIRFLKRERRLKRDFFAHIKNGKHNTER